MHYYQFNIGDYYSHTSHLSASEDLAYRKLIDWQYLNEKPIPSDLKEASRLINMRDNLTDVEQVLNEFFILDDGYINKRIFSDIESYKEKIEKASIAGKASAKARKAKVKQEVVKRNERSTDVKQTFNQPPTINHKPITNNKDKKAAKARPTSASEVSEYALTFDFILDGQAFIDHYEANGWMRGNSKIKCWKACVRTWKARESKQVATKKTNGNAQWEQLISKLGEVGRDEYPEWDDPLIAKALFQCGSWMELKAMPVKKQPFEFKPKFIECYNSLRGEG